MSAEDETSNTMAAIEQRAWKELSDAREKEDRLLEQELDEKTKPLKLELVELYSDRTKLEGRIRAIKKDVAEREARLSELEKEADSRREQIAMERVAADERMRAILREGLLAEAEAQGGEATNGITEDRMEVDAEAADLSAVIPQPREEPQSLSARSPAAVPGTPDGSVYMRSREPLDLPAGVIAEVMDVNLNRIGSIKEISLKNHWTMNLMAMQVKRPIIIRSSRRFTAENLQSIYEPSDTKGAKWIGCMIQAMGDVQHTPCDACTRTPGVFEHCIMISNEGLDAEFPRCGNCEWGRQGCHGAYALPPRGARAISRANQALEAREGTEGTEGGASPARFSSMSMEISGDDNENRAKEGPAARRSLPNGKTSSAAKPITSWVYARSEDGTVSVVPDPSCGIPNNEDEAADDAEPELPAITRSMLSLRHDHEHYTAPEIMVGVPTRKITMDDEYWDPSWKDLRESIQAQLDKWTNKWISHPKDSNSNAEKHAKFLAGRQINRGKSIIAFLNDAEIHPYQLVAKKYITSNIGNYDTLYRIVGTVEELRKFRIDCTPIEWLRQRLHEKYLEDPDGFSLVKVCNGLYHDPKVMQIRAKSGFGNIGRPIGYGLKSGAGSAKKQRAAKRKESHSTLKGTPSKRRAAKKLEDGYEDGATGQNGGSWSAGWAQPNGGEDDERAIQQQLGQLDEGQDHGQDRDQQQHRNQHQRGTDGLNLGPGSFATPNGSGANIKNKKHRLSVLETYPVPEDLETLGYTSTDSYSRDRILKVDWRITQVKTMTRSSSTDITQYWHWVDKESQQQSSDEPNNFFEHQVLREVDPAEWGVYKEPVDFHLRVPELVKIQFAPEHQRVVIVTREVKGVDFRGDVLAQFKRERTKRRFLKYMRRKGVKLYKVDGDYINEVWDSIQSNTEPVDVDVEQEGDPDVVEDGGELIEEVDDQTPTDYA